MPSGPADNSPTCPVCGLYPRVHGCTAETCANPAGAAATPSWCWGPNWCDGGAACTCRPPDAAPPGYVSIASTGADVQAARVCECDRCTAEGQHAPMCAVHWEPPKACDCGKAPVSPG